MCTETFCFISVFKSVSFIEIRRLKYLFVVSRGSLEAARLSVQCAKVFFPRVKATWTRRLGQLCLILLVAEVVNLHLPCHVTQQHGTHSRFISTLYYCFISPSSSSSFSGPRAYAPDAPQPCRLIVLPSYYSSVFRRPHLSLPVRPPRPCNPRDP